MKDENLGESFWIMSRLENFYINLDATANLNASFFAKLQELCMQIEVDIQKLRGMSTEQTLNMIFSRIYNFVISSNDNYSLFDNNMEIYDASFDACFFYVLCSFLHHTKRLKAYTLREFTYLHAPENYNVPGTSNYFNYQNTKKESIMGAGVKSREDVLRKYRERLFKHRTGYTITPEWSGMRKYSEHEWILYFLKEKEPEIESIIKRIKNLYNGIWDAIDSPKDNGYGNRLETAYDKFSSSLEKLQYESFLKLCKFCIAHIRENSEAYGINLYRLEKELKLYQITNEVNQLLGCKDENEEAAILDKSMAMQDIVFPKLYEYFSSLSDPKDIYVYSSTFQSFQNELVIPSFLIIDKFLEDGSLGSDWEKLFLKRINEMAETVLYNPENIDYSINDESQNVFYYDISIPVCKIISYHYKIWEFSQFESDNQEDF